MAAISVQGLRKAYGDRVAVDGISFCVEPGEIFGILGPNGAGKTTTVECVVGLRAADAGTIDVLGLDPRRQRAELTHTVGVQLQTALLQEKITVGEAMTLYASLYDDAADPAVLLDRLQLADSRDVRFGRLSGGQQQRLAVALALIGRPRVAVLDEVSTGLDPQARREVWSLIEETRAAGATVVLVTHFMEEAERLCDRLALIDHGRIVATGSPSEVVDQLAGGGQQLRFRVDGAFDASTLAAVPNVTGVTQSGDAVTVTGGGDVILAVTSELARRGVVAHDLRVHSVDLDDAFVALTRGEAR
ncbi:MAG TPA: ABC transporter ATP-binding protein [Jatrophihabitans sp.]|nr:ABC transporter ATP-binding protein [Jatrophihabitans sp.]